MHIKQCPKDFVHVKFEIVIILGSATWLVPNYANILHSMDKVYSYVTSSASFKHSIFLNSFWQLIQLISFSFFANDDAGCTTPPLSENHSELLSTYSFKNLSYIEQLKGDKKEGWKLLC